MSKSSLRDFEKRQKARAKNVLRPGDYVEVWDEDDRDEMAEHFICAGARGFRDHSAERVTGNYKYLLWVPDTQYYRMRNPENIGRLYVACLDDIARAEAGRQLTPAAVRAAAPSTMTEPAGPVPKGYEELADVLDRALDQAARGKGKERHANDKPFVEQPMQTISGMLRSPEGLRYQVIKKTQESAGLPHDRAVTELLGAIVYAAGAIIYMERNRKDGGGADHER